MTAAPPQRPPAPEADPAAPIRSGPRVRTRFERSLFLGFVLVTLTLGAVSVISLSVTGRNLESLFERLWTETGSEAVNRDLAFFTLQYLDHLARTSASAAARAARPCGSDTSPAPLECVFERLGEEGAIPPALDLRCLQLYRGSAGSWIMVAERCATDAAIANRAGAGRAGGPAGASGGERSLPAEDLDRFLESSSQPVQRRVGSLVSLASWEAAGSRAGTRHVLVSILAVDSVVTARWRRSVANVERPSFAPFLSQLVWRQSAWLLGGMALVTFLSVFVSRVLSARVSRPLSDLVAAMGQVSRGNLAYRAPQMAQQEFGFLASSFNSMTENIQRLNREARETARIRRELEVAREIQLKLFPQELPRLEGYDLFAANQPSLEVSGDYYDVLPWGNRGAVALAMADVSGKGVPAALLMSNLQACLHSQSVRPPERPGEWIAGMNRQLFENTEAGRFVTFFLGVLDASSRALVYVNGGHNPPLLLRRDGRQEELTEGGPLLGAFPDARYVEARVQLEAGDLLVLYTDGVTEARSAAGDEFGEERLAELLQKARSEPAAIIGARVFAAVRAHSQLESHADDTTLIVLKCGGEPAPPGPG